MKRVVFYNRSPLGAFMLRGSIDFSRKPGIIDLSSGFSHNFGLLDKIKDINLEKLKALGKRLAAAAAVSGLLSYGGIVGAGKIQEKHVPTSLKNTIITRVMPDGMKRYARAYDIANLAQEGADEYTGKKGYQLENLAKMDDAVVEKSIEDSYGYPTVFKDRYRAIPVEVDGMPAEKMVRAGFAEGLDPRDRKHMADTNESYNYYLPGETKPRWLDRLFGYFNVNRNNPSEKAWYGMNNVPYEDPTYEVELDDDD